MEILGTRKVWTRLDKKAECTNESNSEIRGGKGFEVANYIEMAEVVAELQFRNADQVLLFRGQNRDFKNQQGNSSILPVMFRPVVQQKAKPKKVDPELLQNRYKNLLEGERLLIESFKKQSRFGKTRIYRSRLVRWAILQHYDVCPTPLLDVTHSLRIAASFACMDCEGEAYLYVLGVPQLSGAVTVDAASGTQIIRLSSVCPPSAARPHLQEGYLLSEYPDIGDSGQIENYKLHEVDFGRRLIAKLRFNPESFWQSTGEAFPQVPLKALYPSGILDDLKATTVHIKKALNF
jgi:hypothetical protein